MAGLDMMLKAMGFDPAATKQQIEGAAKEFLAIKLQLNRIEQNQIALLNHFNLSVSGTSEEQAQLLIKGE